MIRSRTVLLMTLAGVVLLPVAGCAWLLPKPPPLHFFVLDASDPGEAGEPLSVALGVGPVQLPGYLDRPQIVTRTGPNTVAYAETERWATPLQQAVTNLLMLDLGRRLRTDRITAFPFALGLPRDYDVSVDFFHFEPKAEGGVWVEALWRIRDATSGTERIVKRTDLSLPATAGDFAAAASGLSTALGSLADEIASALRTLHARR